MQGASLEHLETQNKQMSRSVDSCSVLLKFSLFFYREMLGQTGIVLLLKHLLACTHCSCFDSVQVQFGVSAVLKPNQVCGVNGENTACYTVVSALRMEQRTHRDLVLLWDHHIWASPTSDGAEFSDQGMLLGHKEQSLK